MKKTIHVLLLFFSICFICSTNLFAQLGSYLTVTGITFPTAANGQYTWIANDGPGGRPHYQHTSSDYFLYAYNDFVIYWYIDSDMSPGNSIYFAKQDESMTAPPNGYTPSIGGGDPQVVDSSLPVELASFTARVTNMGVQLLWLTESEIDNLGFMVERRTKKTSKWDQIASFQTHDQLQGRGTTSERNEYEFIDERALEGLTYQYRLSDVDIKGQRSYYDPIDVAVSNIAGLTRLFTNDPLPDKYTLLPAFPNPFNPQTTFRFFVPEAGSVSLQVYDLNGRFVASLVDEHIPDGLFQTTWNATNIPSGTYLVVLRSGTSKNVQKVVLLK